MTRADDISRASEDTIETWALDIIHARTTGIRDDVWTEGELLTLQRYFSKPLGGIYLSFEAIMKLVESMIAEGRNVMQEYMNA